MLFVKTQNINKDKGKHIEINMVRIAGVNIPDNKRLEVALTAIYGIGRSLSRQILNKADINFDTKPSQLSEEEINRLKDLVEKYRIEGVLREEIRENIKRLKDIGSWRGMRLAKGLPARGQQTRTNNRTVRGNVRRTMFSGKRKLEKT
jgi:small subunit ribosomal protein S13